GIRDFHVTGVQTCALPISEARAAGVATLDEVLEAIPSDIGLDFDVKTVLEDAVDPPARRTVSLLVPYLKRHARLQRVFVCSFDRSEERRVGRACRPAGVAV